jgi:hypothetical protein
MNKIMFPIYLTHTQHEYYKSLSRETGVSMAELMRQALDKDMYEGTQLLDDPKYTGTIRRTGQ